MTGLPEQPGEDAEAIDATGGSTPATSRKIAGDGFVKIVDRKKELIINAAGKNMSPANIEAAHQSRQPADRDGGRDR